MKVLALDTAVTGCSVAFLDTETGVCLCRSVDTERGQAELLVPLIEEVAKSAQVPLSGLDRIAITTGPGSFTGVRIGLATARALGLALDIPVLGFTTLEILARQSGRAGLFLIDTKRGDFYGQEFSSAGEEVSEARIWSAEDVAAWEGVAVKDAVPAVEEMARLAVTREAVPKKFDPDDAPVPLYLREAEVSQPKRPPPSLCCAE
jgi:tRNA threonylcarbamoyladenosine biosynthesis protein TsaB